MYRAVASAKITLRPFFAWKEIFFSCQQNHRKVQKLI